MEGKISAAGLGFRGKGGSHLLGSSPDPGILRFGGSLSPLAHTGFTGGTARGG